MPRYTTRLAYSHALLGQSRQHHAVLPVELSSSAEISKSIRSQYLK